jgi:hypothetical protein
MLARGFHLPIFVVVIIIRIFYGEHFVLIVPLVSLAGNIFTVSLSLLLYRWKLSRIIFPVDIVRDISLFIESIKLVRVSKFVL